MLQGLKLGFLSTFTGQIGAGLGSALITGASAQMGKFVSPIVNIEMGGIVLKGLRGMKPKGYGI